jgi:hypothetical protein
VITYRAGVACSLDSHVLHVVVDGPPGSFAERVGGASACGRPVWVRPTEVTSRNWLCRRCRWALQWGANRTLAELDSRG